MSPVPHSDAVPPEIGTPLEPAWPSAEFVRALRLRRSTSAELLDPPGPDATQLRAILEIGARVPDHRRVFPFRFILFAGDGRRRAGDILAAAARAADPAAADERIETERRRFSRAPVVIGVVSKVDRAHKTPEWEQVLSAGAVCMNILHAASAHGFGACWITEWCAYDPAVLSAFGLGESERIAGFIHIGTARENPKERPRPDLAALITEY